MKNKKMLKFIYTLCFIAFCIINWAKVTLDGRTQMTAANLTGVVIAIIILCSFEYKSFLKPVYGIWFLLCVFIVPISCKLALKTHPYQGQTVTTCINFAICGFVVIRVAEELLWEKKAPNGRKAIFIIWLLLIVWMIISVNEDIWPIWFGILTGAFYLTDIDKNDIRILFRSAVDGTIISFFILQGAAFAFRPFDSIRYLGIFMNPNMNGLFVVISYAAFLCKWYILKKDEKSMVFRFIIAMLSGAMFGFAIFTASKASIVTLVFETIPFIIFITRDNKRKVLCFLKYGCSIIFLGLLSIPIDYLAIRYLPTVHLHPIFYEAEYSERKVLPGEPRDSEKYITFEQAMDFSLGRIFYMIKNPKVLSLKTGFTLYAYAEGLQPEEQDYLYTEEEYYEGVEPIDLRVRIYKSYINRLNMLGHKNNYEWVAVHKDSYASHAHNMFIQMAFLYGIPVGLLFIVMVITYVYGIAKMIRIGENEKACIISCFIIGVIVFGMFEENWLLGQMHFTLFFLFFREIVTIPNKNIENVSDNQQGIELEELNLMV